MKFHSPAARAALAGVSVVLLAAGCTGNGTVEGPDARATAGAAETPEPGDGEQSPGAEEAGSFEDEAGVLNVAVGEPNSLDPMRIHDPGSVLIARQLFEGLTRWDPVALSVEPAMAESIDASRDGRTYRFRLRSDATFHNGDPVTSRDFAFAFNRIAQKKNAADVAYLLELVRGFDRVNAFGDAKRLPGIKTPTKRTLIIELSEPYANFPAVLTHPSLVPLPEKAFEASDSFASEPIGNGPFELARPFELGAPVELKAFEGYGKEVALEGIRFLPFPDAAASWVRFSNGELDVAEVPASRVEQARENYGEAGFVPLLVGSYYGFNLDSNQLDDIRKRRAINHAIDRESIADEIFMGTLLEPRGIVPTGMPGFDNDACGELCTHDPAAARRLVRRLPKSQRSVTVEFTRDQPQRKVARAVAGDLEEVGLEVELRAYRINEFLKRLGDERQAMYRLGWIAEHPDPHVFLSALFESDSPDNHTAFSSDAVDSLLRRAQRVRNDDVRNKLYKRVERRVLAQVPVAPLGSFQMFWATQPRVEGLVFDVLGGFDAEAVSLASR